jgi:hypothetical protein
MFYLDHNATSPLRPESLLGDDACANRWAAIRHRFIAKGRAARAIVMEEARDAHRRIW